jgi:hypothetical protein
MSYVMVDVESDGPIPGDFSLVCFGAVVVEPTLSKTFYGRTRPISKRWNPDALAVSGFSRAEHETFDDPKTVMERFAAWIPGVVRGGPRFVSDNNGYDWMWICWYLHHFLDRNPFGYSSANLGSMYRGLVHDDSATFKHLRKTRHSHHPVDDAKGNAEAMLHMRDAMGMKIVLD